MTKPVVPLLSPYYVCHAPGGSRTRIACRVEGSFPVSRPENHHPTSRECICVALGTPDARLTDVSVTPPSEKR